MARESVHTAASKTTRLKIAAWAGTLLSAALFTTVLPGCKREENKSTVLAQVGTAKLTLEELRESFPAEIEPLIRREQYLDFIKRWIDDEVVYQQALKGKLDADPAVGRKIEKLRRKLMIEEFLSRENASEVFEPDEMAMNQYYEMHKEDFRRKGPEVKFVHIRVQTNKQAAELRGKAMRGDFLALSASNSLDAVPESYASVSFKKQSEFPPCLAQELGNSGIGGVTLPIACPDGFYLLKILERQEAGSMIPFAEAKEEISGILTMERKDKMLEDRVAKYKEGLVVSYNLDQVPGQADSGKPASPASGSAPAGATPAAAPAGAAPAGGTPGASPAATQGTPKPALPVEPPDHGGPGAASPTNPAMSPTLAASAHGVSGSRSGYRKRSSHANAKSDSAFTPSAKPSAKPALDPTSETNAPAQAAKPEPDENSNAKPSDPQ